MKFEHLLAQASSILQIWEYNNDPTTNESVVDESTKPYADLGIFLSSHCHVLLAIWNGKFTNEIGGTSQVVYFHHEDHMPGYTEQSLASLQRLADDESDLVYHIVCSRNRSAGEPESSLKPLEWYWYTKDVENSRSKELPIQHKKIFARGAEFNRDITKYSLRIYTEMYSLIVPEEKSKLSDGVESIDRLFGVADWLAIYYKKLSLRTLFITHTAAFFMGLMFLLYSDFSVNNVFMLFFLIFFGAAIATDRFTKKRGWTRKYLDYRTLAEGLRVQFYWASAGISNEGKWRFAHDSFLQTQDPEFGWIRHVMRVAGTNYDASPKSSTSGLDYAIREWVGNGSTGQLGYYKKVASERIKRERLTKLADRISLSISGISVLIFLLFGTSLSDNQTSALFLLMGTTLLLYAIREGYSNATAVKELIKQYEFMLRIFDNAHRRLKETDDNFERKKILIALGQSALEEHADWILMHHERSLDQSEIWRMGN
ncbi:MAG: hypothetical protein GKR91_08440 [Pseudomonadales bacterium]|nr:hypothetical protein [Pseudomonadales bacterium]